MLIQKKKKLETKNKGNEAEEKVPTMFLPFINVNLTWSPQEPYKVNSSTLYLQSWKMAFREIRLIQDLAVYSWV